MEILIRKTQGRNILNKISYALIGVLSSSIIISSLIKLLGTYGIWISIILCAVLSFLGLTKTAKGSVLRLISWGFAGITLISLVIVIGVFVVIY
jgi:hypothetical protein